MYRFKLYYLGAYVTNINGVIVTTAISFFVFLARVFPRLQFKHVRKQSCRYL